MGDSNYRQSVYAFITDEAEENILLINKLNNTWDFPGGGVEVGVTLELAIQRELYEELGINDFQILYKSKITNKYDWPNQEIENAFKKTGHRYIGQEQHFFLLKIHSSEEIIVNSEEIKGYVWVSFSQVKSHMSYQDQYKYLQQVLNEYANSVY